MKSSNTPSHFFFLPISAEALSNLTNGAPLINFTSSAATPELISLLLLLDFHKISQQNPAATTIERLYEKALRQAVTPPTIQKSKFVENLNTKFNKDTLRETLALIESYGVRLLSEVEIHNRDYLTTDGNWDFTFSARQRERSQPFRKEITLSSGTKIKLSDQQGRVFDEFKVCMDESFHIQGYAGVGKTYLIARLFDFLNPASTLFMALIPQQVEALKSKVSQFSGHDNITAMTFGRMANLLLNMDRTSQGWRITDSQRTQTNYLVTDQQIATWLKFNPVNSLHPKEVATICRRTVFAFCQSPSMTIEARHLPAIKLQLSETDVAVLMEYSKLYWNELIRPSEREIRIPIRNAHRIKFLSLRNDIIPESYTHVIIDESHELTAPMIQILDRSPQSVITLGDEFQNLSNHSSSHGSFIRQRNITQSLRAGSKMSEVLNPLIQAHPNSIKDSFEGLADHSTSINSYKYVPIPTKPTTIIVSDLWGILYWFIRLTTAKASFELPQSVHKDFTGLFYDLITLYTDSVRPRHRMIFNFSTWDKLMETFGGFRPLADIQRLLEKGFTYSDFQERINSYCKPGGYIYLARIEDVKNQEFNSVLVGSDLLRPISDGNSNHLGTACAKLYTACSRAKYELEMPGEISDWLKDATRPQQVNSRG